MIDEKRVIAERPAPATDSVAGPGSGAGSGPGGTANSMDRTVARWNEPPNGA
ncbi:hypothetical protein AB0D14_38015 [Streptomyces sp. NPDC048484]|uniref:hypothetical protein n=1 Tax=Streptomyces sp. NPDC048484 TaxID=3155146 RepID=UPI00342F08A3